MLSPTFKPKKTIIFLGLKMKKHIKCNDNYLINHLKENGSLNPMLKTEDYKLNCEDNDYIVGRKLGSGGFNKVYELKDIYNNVIKDKVIRITSKANDRFNNDHFNDEINGLFLQCYIAKICNNVCKVHEFGYLEEFGTDKFGRRKSFYSVYAVLEKLSIPDLDTLRFKMFKKMSKEKRKEYNFRELIRQSLTALKCMNTNDFIHSDIKLSNIGVGLDGYARLFDFGFAKYMPYQSEISNLYGTPFFMDPHFIKNSRIHIKSDIYSFGIILQEIYLKKKKYFRQYFYNKVY